MCNQKIIEGASDFFTVLLSSYSTYNTRANLQILQDSHTQKRLQLYEETERNFRETTRELDGNLE